MTVKLSEGAELKCLSRVSILVRARMSWRGEVWPRMRPVPGEQPGIEEWDEVVLVTLFQVKQYCGMADSNPRLGIFSDLGQSFLKLELVVFSVYGSLHCAKALNFN